jgi:hypothetical protein
VSKTKAPNGSSAQRVVGRPSNSPPPELLSQNTKTLAHRIAFVNSTTVVGNSTSVLEKKVRVRSCLSFLFFVHAAIGCIEHLVQGLAILPFSNADTQAKEEVSQVTGSIPLRELFPNPLDDVLSSQRSGV